MLKNIVNENNVDFFGNFMEFSCSKKHIDQIAYILFNFFKK